MNYGRVIPRSRNGTSGVCVESTIEAARDAPQGAILFTPERVASVGWQVSIPRGNGNRAYFVVETTMSQTESIGDSGDGGVWCNAYDVNKIVRLEDSETGQREAADGAITPTSDGSSVLVLDSGKEIVHRPPFCYSCGCTVNAVTAVRITVLYSTCDVGVAFCG